MPAPTKVQDSITALAGRVLHQLGHGEGQLLEGVSGAGEGVAVQGPVRGVGEEARSVGVVGGEWWGLDRWGAVSGEAVYWAVY